MSISFSGLASGLDTSSWIKSLTALKQAKVTVLQEERETLVSAKDTLASIRSFFSSFRSTIEKITDTRFNIPTMDLFAQNLAVSANMNVLTATATHEAEEGKYEISVDKLATQTQAVSGNRYKTTRVETTTATLDTKLSTLGIGAGNILVTVPSDGLQRGMKIEENDTLQTLINKFKEVGVEANFNEATGTFSMNIGSNDIDDIGHTGIVDVLHLTDVNKGYKTSKLQIENITTEFNPAEEDTLLNYFGVESGTIEIVHNDNTYNFTIDKNTTTFGDLLTFFEGKGIEASLSNGVLSFDNVEITNNGTTNFTTALGLDSEVAERSQVSNNLSYETTIVDVTVADEETLLNDLTGVNITSANVQVTNSNGEVNTINLTSASTLGDLLEGMEDAGLSTTINPDGTIEITGGTITGGTFDAITALGLNDTPYTAFVSGNALTETVTVPEIVTLATEFVDDLNISEGLLKIEDAEGEMHYMVIRDGLSIGEFIQDLGNIGLLGELDEETGVLTITGGVVHELTQSEINSLDAATLNGIDPQYRYVSDILDVLFPDLPAATGTVQTFAMSRALSRNVTNTILAEADTTTLGSLGLTGNETATFDVLGSNVNVAVTTGMTINQFIAALDAKGISASFDEDTHRLTINNAKLTSTGTLADALQLTTTESNKYTASIATYADSTVTIYATEATTLEQLGITANQEIKFYDETGQVINKDYDGNGVANDSVFNATKDTTIGEILEAARKAGITAVIENGVIKLDGGYIENANVESVLGLETTTTDYSHVLGDYLTDTETVNADYTTKLEDIGITSNKTLIIKNRDGDEVASIDFTKTQTLGNVATALQNNGITVALSDGVLSFSSASGNYITGDCSLAQALGIGTKDQAIITSTTYKTDNLLTNTTLTMNRDTTLADLGITDYALTVNEPDGDTVNKTFEATTKVGEILDWMSANGVSASVSDGVISLSSTTGAYVTGALATAFGITTVKVEETITVGVAQSSSGVISYDTTIIATSESLVFDIIGTDWIADAQTATGGAATETQLRTIEIRDPKIGGTNVGYITVTNDMTVGDLLTALAGYGISGEIQNGVIHLTSSEHVFASDFINDGLGTSYGVLTELGITTVMTTQVVTTTIGSVATGEQLEFSTTVIATTDSLLTELGKGIVVGDKLEILDVGGENSVEFVVAAGSTIQDMFDALAAKGIAASITDGIITIDGSNGFVRGDVATKLGLDDWSSIVTPTTVPLTVSSSDKITYTGTGYAEITSKLTELGKGIAVGDKFEIWDRDDGYVTDFVVAADSTIQDLRDALAAQGIASTLIDGVLTIENSVGFVKPYDDGDASTNLDLATKLGIGILGETITATVGIDATTTEDVTYSYYTIASENTTFGDLGLIAEGETSVVTIGVNLEPTNCIATVIALVTTPTFTITSAEEWNAMAAVVNAMTSAQTANVKIVLANDIDFDHSHLTSLGTSLAPFRGQIDGQGHAIKNAIIASKEGDYAGVVEYAQDAKIWNLSVIDGVIAEGYQGYRANGILVGKYTATGVSADNASEIYNCNTSGIVEGGGEYNGGVIGEWVGPTTNDFFGIYNVVAVLSSATVIASSTGAYAGGIIGHVSGDIGVASLVSMNRGIKAVSGSGYAGAIVGYCDASTPAQSWEFLYVFNNYQVDGTEDYESIANDIVNPFAGTAAAGRSTYLGVIRLLVDNSLSGMSVKIPLTSNTTGTYTSCNATGTNGLCNSATNPYHGGLSASIYGFEAYKRYLNDVLPTITVTSESTLGNFITKMGSYGIEMTLENGVLNVNNTSDVAYMTGDLITALGMDSTDHAIESSKDIISSTIAVTYTTTVKTSVGTELTSTAPITYDKTTTVGNTLTSSEAIKYMATVSGASSGYYEVSSSSAVTYYQDIYSTAPITQSVTVGTRQTGSSTYEEIKVSGSTSLYFLWDGRSTDSIVIGGTDTSGAYVTKTYSADMTVDELMNAMTNDLHAMFTYNALTGSIAITQSSYDSSAVGFSVEYMGSSSGNILAYYGTPGYTNYTTFAGAGAKLKNYMTEDWRLGEATSVLGYGNINTYDTFTVKSNGTSFTYTVTNSTSTTIGNLCTWLEGKGFTASVNSTGTLIIEGDENTYITAPGFLTKLGFTSTASSYYTMEDKVIESTNITLGELGMTGTGYITLVNLATGATSVESYTTSNKIKDIYGDVDVFFENGIVTITDGAAYKIAGISSNLANALKLGSTSHYKTICSETTWKDLGGGVGYDIGLENIATGETFEAGGDSANSSIYEVLLDVGCTPIIQDGKLIIRAPEGYKLAYITSSTENDVLDALNIDIDNQGFVKTAVNIETTVIQSTEPVYFKGTLISTSTQIGYIWGQGIGGINVTSSKLGLIASLGVSTTIARLLDVVGDSTTTDAAYLSGNVLTFDDVGSGDLGTLTITGWNGSVLATSTGTMTKVTLPSIKEGTSYYVYDTVKSYNYMIFSLDDAGLTEDGYITCFNTATGEEKVVTISSSLPLAGLDPTILSSGVRDNSGSSSGISFAYAEKFSISCREDSDWIVTGISDNLVETLHLDRSTMLESNIKTITNVTTFADLGLRDLIEVEDPALITLISTTNSSDITDYYINDGGNGDSADQSIYDFFINIGCNVTIVDGKFNIEPPEGYYIDVIESELADALNIDSGDCGYTTSTETFNFNSETTFADLGITNATTLNNYGRVTLYSFTNPNTPISFKYTSDMSVYQFFNSIHCTATIVDGKLTVKPNEGYFFKDDGSTWGDFIDLGAKLNFDTVAIGNGMSSPNPIRLNILTEKIPTDLNSATTLKNLGLSDAQTISVKNSITGTVTPYTININDSIISQINAIDGLNASINNGKLQIVMDAGYCITDMSEGFVSALGIAEDTANIDSNYLAAQVEGTGWRSDAKFSVYGISGSGVWTIMDATTGTTETVDWRASKTVGDFLRELQQAGINAYINDDDDIVFDQGEKYIYNEDDTLWQKMFGSGANSSTYTDNGEIYDYTNDTSDALTDSGTKTIHAATIIGNLDGLATDGSYKITVYDSGAGEFKDITVSGSGSVADMFTALTAKGIIGSITGDGKVVFSSSNGSYITSINSSLETALKLSAPYNEESYSTVHSGDTSDSLDWTYLTIADRTTLLSQIGITENGSIKVYVESDDGIPGNGTIESVDFTPDMTLGDLFDALAEKGIYGTIDNGVISFIPTGDNYIVNQSGPHGGVDDAFEGVIGIDFASDTSTEATYNIWDMSASNPLSYVENYTMTSGTTFGDLEVSDGTNMVVKVTNNDGNVISITMQSENTVGDFISALAGAGISSEIIDGKLYIKASNSAYISQMDDTLAGKLGLKLNANIDDYKTTIEDGTTVNKNSTLHKTHNKDLAITADTLLTAIKDKGITTTDKATITRPDGTTQDITVEAGDTVSDFFSKIAQYGMTGTIDTDGKITIVGTGDTTISGTLINKLGVTTTVNKDTITTNTSSNKLEHIVPVAMHDGTLLEELGINDNGGKLKLYKDGVEHTITLQDGWTVADFRNKLSDYGITSEIIDGKLSLTSDGVVRFVDVDSNAVEKFGIEQANWSTVGKFHQESDPLSDIRVDNPPATMQVQLEKLTDADGNVLKDSSGNALTSGNIYVYQDGTRHTVYVDKSDTVETLASKLSPYGITVTMDQHGVISFAGDNNSYIADAGESNLIDVLKIGTWNTVYNSTSRNLQYTEDDTAVINGETKMVDILGGNSAVTTGTYNVVSNGVTTVEEITDDTTVNDFIATLSTYGMTASINSDGQIAVGGQNNTYLKTSTYATGNSNVVSALFNEWNFVNAYESNHLEIPTPVIETITRDTRLDNINEGDDYEAGYITVVKDGVQTDIELTADETVGTLMDELALYGFECTINGSGQLIVKNTGNSELKAYTGGNTASNALDILGIGSGWIKTNLYTGAAIDVIEETDETRAADRTTKLSDLEGLAEEITTGEYYIYSNGVRYTALISSDETVGSFLDTLAAFGIQANIVSTGTASVLQLQGNGDSYITTAPTGNSSNVATVLFPAAGGDTVYNYDSKQLNTSTLITTHTDANEDTLLKDLDINWADADVNAQGQIAVNVDGNEAFIQLTNNETVGSLLGKFRALGLEASISNGEILISDGFSELEILTDPALTTSAIYSKANFAETTDLGGYCASNAEITWENVITEDVNESVAAWIDDDTVLDLLNISSGTLTVFRNGEKATINVDRWHTFSDLRSLVAGAFDEGDVTIKLEKGYLEFCSTNPDVSVEVGATTDTSNIAAICGLANNKTGSVKSARELYQVNNSSQLTASGIFRLGNVSEGTFTIGDAEFEITNQTTLSSIIAQINSSEEANATAFWDSIDGKLVLKSRTTGSAFINIEAGTSNFTDIMGFTKTENAGTANQVTKINVEAQEVGDNASFSINGTHYTSTSNTITSDLSRITGVTINLKGVSEGGSTTLTIERDKETVANAVSDVVDAYNELIENVDKEVARGAELADQSTLKLIRNQIRSLMTSSLAGSGVFKNLDQVGIVADKATANSISTDRVNVLTFDKDKFLEAFDADRDALKDLLVGTDAKLGIFSQVENVLESSLAGVYGYFDSASKGYDSKISRLDDKIAKAQKAVERYTARLEAKFSAMDLLIAKMQNQYSSFLG